MNIPESMINYRKVFEINEDITDYGYDIILSNDCNLNRCMDHMRDRLACLRDRIHDILIEKYPFVWDSSQGGISNV